jgi:riboflavin kinase/FMN adenylyltransferase
MDAKMKVPVLIEWQQFLKKGMPVNIKPSGKLTSMTIGNFDGIHRGHQALIKRIVLKKGFVPVVVTFRQNFKTAQMAEQKNILDFRQKLVMLKNLGIKIVIVIDFTEDFRQIPGIKFLRSLHKNGSIGFFAIGDDFRCGYKQDTNAEAICNFFTSHKIPVEIIPPVIEGSLPISSSRIRTAIAEGDTILAEKMLGYALAVSG